MSITNYLRNKIASAQRNVHIIISYKFYAGYEPKQDFLRGVFVCA